MKKMKIYKIHKMFEFEAGHYLPNYSGPSGCGGYHGHSYKLEVGLKGPADEKTGMVMDFGDLKRKVNEMIISKLDHSWLNDIFGNPSAENMIGVIWDDLSQAFEGKLYRLRLWETSGSYAEYDGEEV
jgi:6-pyruvoyltetrahydropterin/6-carboxytetrahydropterin synthase